MHRFFAPPEAFDHDQVRLPDDVVHHLRTVLRLTVGDELLLLDGLGTICRCRLESLGKTTATARILTRRCEAERVFPIRLIQSLPKGDKMDLILQKGTELGIASFSPIGSERGIGRIKDDRQSSRRQRWEKIIREAARQSRRPLLPQLHNIRPLEEVLTACTADLRLMLWEEETLPLSRALPAKRPASAALLVGPEGGFSQAEAELARRCGFQPVSLGPRILRSETAGFAVASILQYIYGDMGTPDLK